MSDSVLITVLGAMIGAATTIIVATIQVKKTYKTSYQIEAYKNISAKVKEFLEKHSIYVASLVFLQARHQRILDEKPIRPNLGDYSFTRLLDELNDVVNATEEIIHLIDIYQIICPRFDRYRNALQGSYYAIHNEEFANLLLQFQPRKDEDPCPVAPPIPGRREELLEAIKAQSNRVADLFWQVDDFSVAAQNVLMGDVFHSRVEYHSPLEIRNSPIIKLEEPLLKKHKRLLFMLLGVVALMLAAYLLSS